MSILVKGSDNEAVEATAPNEKLQEFRDDLRQPEVKFGRCALTGEWGKCVAIDLGDICIHTPDVERAIVDDSGQITFDVWKPVVFENQVTFSEQGLQKLLAYAQSQENPIPSLTPVLVYEWQVLYTDGSSIRQYKSDPETYEEIEVNSREIDFDRIAQFSVISRQGDLPNYTFVKETGCFYRDGQLLDLDYEGPYQEASVTVYARRVTHSYSSQTFGLSREISSTYTNVLQLLGWKVGGLKGPGPGCLIGIDERGNWRQHEYTY